MSKKNQISKNLSKYRNIALLAIFVLVVILIRLFWYPVLEERTSNLENHNKDFRRIIISNMKLEIPKSFVIGSTASKDDCDQKVPLLAFTYPELKGGVGDGKDYVSLWFEDARGYHREYKKLGLEVCKKWRTEQKFPAEEYNRFEQLILKRKEMIKETFGEKIPFALSYIPSSTYLTCDSNSSVSNPKCEYAFLYKDLYILIIFKAEDMTKYLSISRAAVELITQWSAIDEHLKTIIFNYNWK
jgi:hypothetical protein